MEALQWCGAGHNFPSGRQVGGKKKEEAERVMGSTISFIQANLQHSIAASGILTRTVGFKIIDTALVQELWYCEDCIRGLDIPFTLLERKKDLERVFLRGT